VGLYEAGEDRGAVVHLPHMTAGKETTLREVGEMLTHVVEHMATKEDVAKLDTRIDDLRTEMIDQFERADKQFRATHDRLRDMAAEITVIHRRVERLEELGASKWIGSCRTQGLTLTNSRSDGSIMRWGRVQISLLPWTGPTLMSITRRRLCCRWSLSLPHCRSASSCQMHALPTRLRLQRRCIFRIFKVQLRVAGVVLQQQDAERRGHNTFFTPASRATAGSLWPRRYQVNPPACVVLIERDGFARQAGTVENFFEVRNVGLRPFVNRQAA
jgi:hypothetical protein